MSFNWEGLERQLFESWAENMRAQDEHMFGPEEYRRKGHTETPKWTAERIAAREEFKQRFELLVAEGEEQGFLEHEHCYECGGELRVTTHTRDTDYIWDETPEQWKARIAELPRINTVLYGPLGKEPES